jgi:hypothetical protein
MEQKRSPRLYLFAQRVRASTVLFPGSRCHLVPGAKPRGLRAFLCAGIRFQLSYSKLIV